MEIAESFIEGVYVVALDKNKDRRGEFSRLYCKNELGIILQHREIRQINRSLTLQVGSVRGLHYQKMPHAEMKFVQCIRGAVFDVALDLRSKSKTFGQYVTEVLSPERNVMFVIPEGCAHGFQVLERNSELLYYHTQYYDPASECGVRYDDPRFGLSWPLPVTGLSDRDMKHEWLDNSFLGI